ncbi:hypothetical protein ACIBH1_44725 [Nonomuraea sp. NPDC050663]|uniref:hypothetical protein n=1 Tax=Nonomuraea sp. NPDC050663 TaxID=3364370 RepID=UPI0037AB3758
MASTPLSSTSPSGPSSPSACETFTLNAGPYGTLEVRARPDLATGRLRCQVNGLRVRGVFIIEPDFPDNPDPAAITRVKVSYGDLPPAHFHDARHRANRPVLYSTVTLVCHSFVDLAAAQSGGSTSTPYTLGATIWRQDPATASEVVEVPYGTGRLAAAILAVLAVHWLQRPGADQLRLAAARHAIATGNLIGQQHRRIEAAEQALAEAEQHLALQRAELLRLRRLLSHPYPYRAPSPSSAPAAAAVSPTAVEPGGQPGAALGAAPSNVAEQPDPSTTPAAADGEPR